VATIYIIIFVLTDLTLTTDTLLELFQSVKPPHRMRPRTSGVLLHNIGIDLGLPGSALVDIKRSYRSLAKRKEAYLDTYTHHHPCPSWNKISELLRKYSLEQQADEVEDTYVKGTV
jgi:hypothetical protein